MPGAALDVYSIYWSNVHEREDLFLDVAVSHYSDHCDYTVEKEMKEPRNQCPRFYRLTGYSRIKVFLP